MSLSRALVNNPAIPDVVAVEPYVRPPLQVCYRGTNWATEVAGVTPAYLPIKLWALDYAVVGWPCLPVFGAGGRDLRPVPGAQSSQLASGRRLAL